MSRLSLLCEKTVKDNAKLQTEEKKEVVVLLFLVILLSLLQWFLISTFLKYKTQTNDSFLFFPLFSLCPFVFFVLK